MSFLNNVFVEFDRENKRVGFASSTCATGNLAERLVTVQPPQPYGNPSTCEPNTKLRCPDDPPRFGPVFWTFVGAACLMLLVSLAYSIRTWRLKGAAARAKRQQALQFENLGLDAGNLSDDSDDALLLADDDDELVHFDDMILKRTLAESELEAIEASKARSLETMEMIRTKSASKLEDDKHMRDLMLIAQQESSQEVAHQRQTTLLE